MKKGLFTLTVLLLVMVLLFSCAPKAGPQEVPTPGKSIPGSSPNVTKQGWEKEWDDTVVAAKKEGKVVAFLSFGGDLREALVKSFMDRFGIVLDGIVGSGAEVSARLNRERSAGLYLSDVYQGGVTTPDLILKPAGLLGNLEENFILPELKDPKEIEKTWLYGQLPWVDPDHKIFAFMAYPQAWAVINTDLVKPEEMKSFKDLLNPKWKGKIAMFDPTMTGAGGKLLSAVSLQILSMDFWRDLAKQDVYITRDNRQLVEWVAHGKYAIALAARPEEIAAFKAEGAPLMHRTPEEGIGITTGSGGLALLSQPAHPNAAKLFINWLLSKEGITVWSKAGDVQSARLDVPTSFLSPEKVRQPGVKYYYLEKEQFLSKEGSLYKEARDIFGVK